MQVDILDKIVKLYGIIRFKEMIIKELLIMQHNKLNIIYNIYLTISFITLSIFSYYNHRNGLFNEVLLILTLLQCYFMFHNIGKLVGVFSISNSSLNGFVNLSHKMYTSFVYSLYGASVGLFLLINGKNKQNEINIKKTAYKLAFIFSSGIIVFIVMNHNRAFSIILLFDLIIFAGNMCGGYLASKQSLWQFVVFIPIGLIQITTGLILHESVYITTSLVYLFSDILSIYKWKLVLNQEKHKLINT